LSEWGIKVAIILSPTKKAFPDLNLITIV
jgi:hypothetical protein